MTNTAYFEQFYKENYESLFLQAFRYLDDEEACKDVVADCFEYAWKHYDDISVKNWNMYLRKLLRNKCIDILRRDKVRGRYEDFYQAMWRQDDEDELTEERIEAIMRVVDSLRPPTSTILEKVFMQRKRYKEVAEEMDISPNTVKKHIMKALRELRTRLLGDSSLVS